MAKSVARPMAESMLRYMLDTNIVIYTMKNRPEQVRQRFNQHSEQLCISSVTYGELVYGCERSAWPEKNLKNLESFVNRLEVLPFDSNAASHFGQLRAKLYSAGKPLRPTGLTPYDMMIAGHARSCGLVLVSNNLKEFERVDGLRLENWL